MTETHLHDTEARIGKPAIKSADKLAKELGFSRNRNITISWYREFIKQIPESKFATLAFQNGKYGGGQRIILGLKLDPTSLRNVVEFNLCQSELFVKDIEKLGLPLDDAKMFVRSELNAGGYQRLFDFLSELEKSGFYTNLLKG